MTDDRPKTRPSERELEALRAWCDDPANHMHGPDAATQLTQQTHNLVTLALLDDYQRLRSRTGAAAEVTEADREMALEAQAAREGWHEVTLNRARAWLRGACDAPSLLDMAALESDTHNFAAHRAAHAQPMAQAGGTFVECHCANCIAMRRHLSNGARYRGGCDVGCVECAAATKPHRLESKP